MRTIELSEGETPSKKATPLVIAAAALLLISGLGSWAFLAGQRDAYLHLDGKSGMSEGRLTVLVDGEQVYSHKFSGVGLVDRLVDKQHETFETHVKVDGGVHSIVAAITDDASGLRYEQTLMVDLKPGEIRELDVLVGNDFGAPLSLRTD